MNAALAEYKNILQLNYGNLISLDHIQTESAYLYVYCYYGVFQWLVYFISPFTLN